MEPSAKLVWKPLENLVCAVIRTDFIIWILLLLSPLQSFDLGLKKALLLKQTREHSQTSATFFFLMEKQTVWITAKLLSPHFCSISFNVKSAKDLSYCYLPEWLKVGIQCHGVQVTAWLSLFGLLLLESGISPGRGVPEGSCLHLPARRRHTDAGASILSLAVSVHGSRAAPYWTDVDVSEAPQCHPGTGNFALSGLCLFWFTALVERAKLEQRYWRCLEGSKSPWWLHCLKKLASWLPLPNYKTVCCSLGLKKKVKCIISVPQTSQNCKNNDCF